MAFTVFLTYWPSLLGLRSPSPHGLIYYCNSVRCHVDIMNTATVCIPCIRYVLRKCLLNSVTSAVSLMLRLSLTTVRGRSCVSAAQSFCIVQSLLKAHPVSTGRRICLARDYRRTRLPRTVTWNRNTGNCTTFGQDPAATWSSGTPTNTTPVATSALTRTATRPKSHLQFLVTVTSRWKMYVT